MKLNGVWLSSVWIGALALTCNFPSVSGSGDGEGSGDFNDDDGFFQFNDEKDSWDDYAISAMRCIEFQNEDVVVFNMYGKNNGECANRDRIATYKATLPHFMRAYTRQAAINAQASGYGYDLDEDILQYLECTYYNNNNGFEGYVKLSCNQMTGRSVQVKSYTDESCTKKANSQYNHNFDISALRIQYDKCESCPVINNNDYYEDEDGNNRKLEDGNNQDNNYYFNSHKDTSPLCSAAWYYKDGCNRSCRKMAYTNGQHGNRGFNGFQRFLAFVLIALAMVLSFAVFGQRKRMDTQDILIEDAAIAKAGIKKEWIPKILIGTAVVILFFMAIKVRSMTFILLLTLNACLFLYWAQLKYRKDGYVDVAGRVIYGNKNKKNNEITDAYHESSGQLS